MGLFAFNLKVGLAQLTDCFNTNTTSTSSAKEVVVSLHGTPM